MPFQVVKDPQTGEERRVYVAPQGMGQQPAKPAAAKPKAQPKAQDGGILGGLGEILSSTPLGVLGTAIGTSASGWGAGIKELQRSGDVGQAFSKAGQAYMKGLEGPGAGKGALRIGANAGRNVLQELSDLVTADIPVAFGDTAVKPTSAKMPDAPFLGMLPALPKAKSSGPAEDLATGFAQVAIEWLPVARAVGLVGKGLKVLPGAAKVGQGVKAVQAAAKNPVAKALVSNTLTKAAATGAVVDFAGFDQHGGRLTDLIDQATKGTPFNALALDYLKSDPKDVGLEGRVKNALEGGLFGTALETALRTMRVARNYNWFRRAPEAEKPAAEEALKKATQDLETEVAKQAYTIPDPWGPADAPPLPGADRPINPNLAPPAVTEVVEMDVNTIQVDPKRIQFKPEGRKAPDGVATPITDEQGYNPLKGGVVSVWTDPADGITYVVDGHSRLAEAKASGYDKLLVRQIQAETADEAKRIGALQNISEGQATPEQAGSFVRQSGMTARDMAAEGITLDNPAIAKQVQAEVTAPTTTVEATPAAAAPEPIKLYRGTKAGAEGSATVGDAFFMTPDRKVAEAYAGKGGTVAEQDVSFSNLLEAPTWMKAKQQLGLAKSASMDDLVRAAREAGYDGLSFTTTNGKEYVQIPAAAAPERPLVKPGTELTHGTSQQAAEAIMQGGFKASKVGRGGTLLGDGVYMTANPRYAGAYGEIAVGGQLPPNARILDLVAQGKTVADFADEIGVGRPAKVFEGEVYFTAQQEKQIANWAKANGYDGIHFDPAFHEVSAGASEVVVYNLDLANQMVGSKAAPAPAPAAAAAPEPSVPSAGSSAPAQANLPVIPDSSPTPAGPTAAEIQELDTVLAQARADLSPQQRVIIRNQLLQQKYEPTMAAAPDEVDLPPQAGREEPTAEGELVLDEGGGAGSPPEPPGPPPTVVEPPPMDEEWARRLVQQMEQQRQGLEEGTVTMDDLLENNVQKFQSPSGRTTYVASPPTNAVQAYRAFSDAISRADATGIPVMSFERVQKDTEAWLAKNNYEGAAVLENLKQLSGSLGNYQENLVALRAAQLYTDHANLAAGVAANKWLNANADVGADVGQLTAELLTAAAQQKAANTALESVTRPVAQLLYSLQNPRPTPGSLPFDQAMPATKNIGEELDKALDVEAQTPVTESIGKALSPEAEEAIATGSYSPQVMAEMDQLARNMAQAAVTPGFAKGFWRQFNDTVAMGARGLVIYRASQLLSSGLTLSSNAINGGVRLVQMPLAQAMGATMRGDFGRASQSLMMYSQYVSNLQNALRLGVESFKAGRGLYDLDDTTIDFLDRLVKEDSQAALMPGAKASGEWNLNTMPWLDVQDKSTWAVAQKRIWQLLNLSTRTQVSLDTFFKTLAGQSFEYVRNLQPGLDRAAQQGFEPGGKEAWSFARDYAQAAVDRATRDVVIDGRTILDAVMESPSAQTAMRYATFTDDIWAEMGPRTYQRGMELAEAQGLKDDAAAEFAQKYAGTDEDIPGFARTFSMMPRVWQKLMDLSPLFSIIQPFNRTPGDIVKSVARMSPVAPFVDTFWRDLNSEDVFTRDRAKGDLALGAAALSLATVAITNGRVEFTGGGPANPEAQKRWRDSGKQSYSFRVRLGDNADGSPNFSPWTSMRAFEPFSSLFGALGDYIEIANKLPREARERLGGALTMDLVTAVGMGQLNKTYYQGFTELYEAFVGMGELDSGPNRVNPMERYISRILASMVPASSALRAGRRIDDRTVRVSQPEDLAEGGLQAVPMRLFQLTMGEIKNMVPGWSEQLPPRRNWITGEPLILSGVMGDQYLPPDQPWLAALYQYAPWSSIQVAPKVDPVMMEMTKLSGKGANFRGPTNSDFGRELRLPPGKFDEYAQTASNVRDQYGRTVHMALEQLINSDFYKSLPDEQISTTVMSQKAAAVDLEVQKFRKLAKDTFLANNPEIQRQVSDIEGLNKDVQYRLKYGQPIDVPGFVEGLR